jgi:hypothetical protein
MSPEELIRAAYEAMNTRNLEALLALMDPAVQVRGVAVRSTRGQWFQGYPGVREWWEGLTATYDRFISELLSLEVDGERAVAKLRATFLVGEVHLETEGWQSASFRNGRILTWARWDSEAEARASVDMAR